MVVGYIGISYCFGAVINWLPMYMTRVMHYSLSNAATISGAIIVLAGLLGAPTGGWVADRWFGHHRGGRGYTLFLACVAIRGLYVDWDYLPNLLLGLALQHSLCFGTLV